MSQASEHTELNARKWDSRAETYDAKWFDYMRYMQKRTIALLPLKENISFLDIGCGTGWAVRYVATLIHQHGEFYGIDISPNMIERAKDNSRDCRNMYFYKANAEELPFQDNLFDLIMCTNSFHHYLQPAKALSEIQRVLKSSGRIYIMDFTADGFLSRMIDRVFRKREPEHVRFYSTREYQRLFADAKLAHVSKQSITSSMKVHIGEKQLQA